MARSNAWCLIEFIPRSGAGEPFTVDVREFPFINTVSVTKNLGMVTQITIGFDMPFDHGLRLLNNEIAPGILFGGTIVRVRMGYGDAGTPNFRQTEDYLGLLNKGGVGLALAPTGLSGNITAVGIGPMAARGAAVTEKTLEEEFSRRVKLAGFDGYDASGAQPDFENRMKDSLKDIGIGSNGAVSHLNFIEAVLFGAKNPMSWSDRVSPKFSLRPFLSPDAETTKTLVVQSIAQNAITSMRFVMRGGFDYNNRGEQISYPIVSFTPDQSEAVYYAGITPEQISNYSAEIDKDGRVTTLFSTPETITVAPTSKKSPDVPNASDVIVQGNISDRQLAVDGPQKTEFGVQVEVTNPESPNMVQMLLDRVQSNATRFVSGLTATLVSFGIPQVLTNTFVIVENVGSFYEGSYRVVSLTHNWTGAEIETTLTLTSYLHASQLPEYQVSFDPSALETQNA
jgi:hypothetical protein